jgi:asparagine synthase (glutamine-hydrolysing)
VDQALFQQVDRLDETARYAPVGRKAVLRRLGLRGLPRELFERPKRGFEMPYDTWIRRGLRTSIDETMRDPAAARAAGLQPAAVERLWKGFLAGNPGLYWSRVWAIFVLLRWCRTHGVSA